MVARAARWLWRQEDAFWELAIDAAVLRRAAPDRSRSALTQCRAYLPRDGAPKDEEAIEQLVTELLDKHA